MKYSFISKVDTSGCSLLLTLLSFEGIHPMLLKVILVMCNVVPLMFFENCTEESNVIILIAILG